MQRLCSHLSITILHVTRMDAGYDAGNIVPWDEALEMPVFPAPFTR